MKVETSEKTTPCLTRQEMLEDELRDLVDPGGVRGFLDVAKEKGTEEMYFWWKG